MYNGYELDFEFSELLFLQKESSKIIIDWILIEEFVGHILENVEQIQTKGSFVLEELHRQVFGDENLYRAKGEHRILKLLKELDRLTKEEGVK